MTVLFAYKVAFHSIIKIFDYNYKSYLGFNTRVFN